MIERMEMGKRSIKGRSRDGSDGVGLWICNATNTAADGLRLLSGSSKIEARLSLEKRFRLARMFPIRRWYYRFSELDLILSIMEISLWWIVMR